jgi:hypothetical protein
MGGACRTDGRNEKCIQYLIGTPERKRPFGRLRGVWEDNIRVELREIGWEVVDCMHLPQYRDQWRVLVNTVMKLRFP